MQLQAPIKVKEVDGINIFFTPLVEHSPPYGTTYEEIEKECYAYFCAKVYAEKDGIELANDYLGSCIYINYSDFYTEKNGYFEDMAKTVLNQSLQKLDALVKPNGVRSWAETHHEIVTAIVMAEERDSIDVIENTRKEQGTGGMYELAIDWTDEFEKKYKGIAWGEELEYFEEIETFIENKLHS